MEFHAYPSSPKVGKTGNLHTFWQMQGLLHSSDSVVPPAVLLITAVVMVMYQHMTERADTTIRNFLVMILLTMFPLAFLEKKLLACVDPVGIMSKFSVKVLMMQVCFLTARLVFNYLAELGMDMFLYRNFAALALGCFLLPTFFGLRLSRACIWEHRDVGCLVVVAFLTAISTEVINMYTQGYSMYHFANDVWYQKRISMLIFFAASDYIEVLTFVPAMWIICRVDKNAVPNKMDVGEAQKRVVALFSFMMFFYVGEDLHSVYMLGRSSPIASMGHIAHFLLLLDFTAFILAHLYDPEKYAKLMDKFWCLMAERNIV